MTNPKLVLGLFLFLRSKDKEKALKGGINHHILVVLHVRKCNIHISNTFLLEVLPIPPINKFYETKNKKKTKKRKCMPLAPDRGLAR